MSSLVALGNTTIESGKLCGDFISFLLGNPLSTSEIMQSCLQQFCTRLFIATEASREVVLLSLIYVQRYFVAAASANNSSAADAQLLVGKLEYMIMTVSCRLAFKWHDDRHMWWRKVEWSIVTGIPHEDIDKFEWQFVNTVGYKLFVSDTEYNMFASLLELLVTPQQPPTPAQVPLALPSLPLSPQTAIKIEHRDDVFSPSTAIKTEPLSPHSIPYVPVKVEDLGDDKALLASMIAIGYHDLCPVSMPPTTSNTNSITDTVMRFSV